MIIISVFTVITMIFSVYSISNAEIIVNGHIVETTVIFFPHSGFTDLSVQHFINAISRWNSQLEWDPVVCSSK